MGVEKIKIEGPTGIKLRKIVQRIKMSHRTVYPPPCSELFNLMKQCKIISFLLFKSNHQDLMLLRFGMFSH